MLAGVLAHHEGALRASLQSEYHLRLLPRGGGRTEPARGPSELADLVEHLPPGCALGRVQGGDAALSQESQMLRHVEYTLRTISYRETGSKGTRPEPLQLPRPAHEERAEAAAMDAKLAAHQAREARRNS